MERLTIERCQCPKCRALFWGPIDLTSKPRVAKPRCAGRARTVYAATCSTCAPAEADGAHTAEVLAAHPMPH